MSGKNLLIIGGLALIAVFTFALLRGDNVSDSNESMSEPTVTEEDTETVSTGSIEARVRLPNATVTVPNTNGVEVTLNDGKGEFEAESVRGTVMLLPDVYAQRQLDVGYDLFGILAVDFGESGIFYYLAVFENNVDLLVHHDTVLIGDRVTIDEIGAKGTTNPNAQYEAVVDFMIYSSDQAMAEEPNTPDTQVYPVSDHRFVTETPAQ